MKSPLLRILLSILLVFSFAYSGAQAESLKKRVDSLFVIASTGTVQYRDMEQPAKDALAAIGLPAVPLLIEKLDTHSARERLTVIRILDSIGVIAVPLLIEALNRPEGLIVQRICWSLGDIGDTSAVDGLMSVASHNRWQVRDQVMRALGKIKDDRAADIVIEAMHDSIGQVRKAAAVASGQIVIHESITQLVHLLGDSFYGARMTAGEALTKLDTSMVLEVLADSINSNDPLVVSQTCHLLGKFGGDVATDLLWQQIHSSADRKSRLAAAIALLSSDPDDLCGFRERVMAQFDGRLDRIKLRSTFDTTHVKE